MGIEITKKIVNQFSFHDNQNVVHKTKPSVDLTGELMMLDNCLQIVA